MREAARAAVRDLLRSLPEKMNRGARGDTRSPLRVSAGSAVPSLETVKADPGQLAHARFRDDNLGAVEPPSRGRIDRATLTIGRGRDAMADDLGLELRAGGEEIALWPDAPVKANAPAEISFRQIMKTDER